jgi:hypothetical protein
LLQDAVEITAQELAPQNTLNFMLKINDFYGDISAVPPMPRSLGCQTLQRVILTGRSGSTSDTMTSLRLSTAPADLGKS